MTGTLVFATIGVLAGDKAAVAGSAQTVALVAIALAAVGLLVSGVHALAAVMRTFDQISPNNVRRVRARTHQVEDVARRELIAAVLIAQRRYSQVATWKLRRLKRATIAFLVGVLAVSVASSAVLAGVL